MVNGQWVSCKVAQIEDRPDNRKAVNHQEAVRGEK